MINEAKTPEDYENIKSILSEDALKILIKGKCEILIKEIVELRRRLDYEEFCLFENINLTSYRMYKSSLEKRIENKSENKSTAKRKQWFTRKDGSKGFILPSKTPTTKPKSYSAKVREEYEKEFGK